MLRVFGKDYVNLHFVARAVDLKHKNDAWRLLYIDAETIAATDGHRLHMIPNTLELAPGLYHIVKRTKTELHLVLSDTPVNEYPNFRRLLPENPELLAFKGQEIFGQYAQIIRALDTYTLNFNYFQDTDPAQFDDFSAADDKPVYMINHQTGIKCLVMPMRG